MKISKKDAAKKFTPEVIYIEPQAYDFPFAQDVLKRLASTPVHEVESYQQMSAAEIGINRRIATEKRSLILAVKKGELVKTVDRDLFRKIPNEFYIIHSMGCPYDCEYCFLYDYLNHQRPTIFVNLPDILERINETINAYDGKQTPVFHAGEFSDALGYDHITNLSEPLIKLFAEQKIARLEMRTKSDYVDNLLPVQHNGRTVISWTFSPDHIADKIEHQTASLQGRIVAAQKVQACGYSVGLRFDPIVWYPQWQEGYQQLITQIFDHLDSSKIADVSLGVFRATPGLKKVIQQRVRKSWLLAGEMVLCSDGKYRYSKPVRREMYRKIAGWIRERAANLKIESCMEAPEVEAAIH